LALPIYTAQDISLDHQKGKLISAHKPSRGDLELSN